MFKSQIENKELDLIINSMPLGVIITDMNICVRYVNKTILNMFNISIEEVINRGPGDCICCINSFSSPEKCGHSEKCHDCKLRKLIKYTANNWDSYEAIEVENTCLINGIPERLWFKITTIPIINNNEKRILINISNITEYKEMQKKIIGMSEFYHSIIECSPDMLWRIDSDKNYVYFNNNWAKFTAISLEEFMENNFIMGMHPDDIIPFKSEIDRAFKNKRAFKFEYRLKRFDGEYRNIISRGNPNFDNYGKFSGYVGLDIDITNNINSNNELLRLKDLAETANRAKSEFLANMSHEIRTPLNGIIGMTDLTLATNLSEEQNENLNIVKNSADSLLSLINDILDFSKIEAEKMIIENIEFNINVLVKKVIDMQVVRANEKSIELSYNIGDKVPKMLMGDPYRLEQILNNLISNALKFTEIGKVVLNIDMISDINETYEIRFAVEDTGIGISESEMKYLFKSFSQVDGSVTRKYGGTGLGLAISQKLVNLMGGNIKVDSISGEGSKFYFSVKLLKAKKSVKEVKPEFQGDNEKHDLNILLAEDDKVNQIVLKQMLYEIGYNKLDIASNGIEALKLKEEHNYDIILMDIQMPELDGIQTTKVIRENERKTGKHIPIAAITAYALQGDKEKFLSKGMDDYISKPINISELRKMINRLMNMNMNTNTINEENIVATYIEKSKQVNNNDEIQIDEDTNIYLSKKLIQIDEYIKEVNTAGKNYYQIERIAHEIKVRSQEKGIDFIKNLAFRIELGARKKSELEIKRNFDKISNILKNKGDNL